MKPLVDYLNMGGYGFFIWSSYGFALLVIIFQLIWTKKQKRKALQQLKIWIKNHS